MAGLFFHPEAFSTSAPKLMGRNAAGESFLRGFLKYGTRCDNMWILAQNVDHARHFAKKAQEFGRTEKVQFVDKNTLGALSQAGTVFYPGPGIGEHAWQRAGFGHAAWSLSGITHTTSSAGAMDAITNLITSPVQAWDAVICTSKAVQANVEKVLQAQVDYLHARLGISKVTLPQFPVIPLGIHTEDFQFSNDQKQSYRQQLGIAENEIAVLFMGRLSFHAKAHPLAMYQALQQAIGKTQKKICLIECGWFANEFIEKAYQDAARLACPDVRVITLDGRIAEQRQAAWASADIFCSLSDNIQETFGIVPIEAMAAGLPVVVSDWDGYKDTVRDGIDGFRIPTWLPQAGLGGDLAFRHALGIDTYDMYCGHTCSLIPVDIEATARAFETLFMSPDKRRTMGEEGRRRASEIYDWKVIIRQYEELWAQLVEIRKSKGSEFKNQPQNWPARLDPFGSFAAYPTNIISLNTVFALVDATPEATMQRLEAYLKLAMVNFAKHIIPNGDEISLIINGLGTGARSAAVLIQPISDNRKAFVFRSLGWMTKIGLIKIES
jgi:starch synthase